MKKYNAISVDASPSNDEGLAFVYFDFGNFKYITLCFLRGEQELIYIENSEQTQSIYSNNSSYYFDKDILFFEFGRDILKETGLDKKIGIQISLENGELEVLKNSLKEIFKVANNNNKGQPNAHS